MSSKISEINEKYEEPTNDLEDFWYKEEDYKTPSMTFEDEKKMAFTPSKQLKRTPPAKNLRSQFIYELRKSGKDDKAINEIMHNLEEMKISNAEKAKEERKKKREKKRRKKEKKELKSLKKARYIVKREKSLLDARYKSNLQKGKKQMPKSKTPKWLKRRRRAEIVNDHYRIQFGKLRGKRKSRGKSIRVHTLGGTRKKNNIDVMYNMGSCSSDNEGMSNFARVPLSGGRRRRRRSRRRSPKRTQKKRRKRVKSRRRRTVRRRRRRR